MQRRRLQLWTALLLAGGVLLRILFVLKHPRFAGDTLLYGDLARNLLQHHIYGFTEATRIRPTLIRLPGYALFLAFCFKVSGMENYAAVLWIQAAVDLLTCCLLGSLARRVFGHCAGLIAFGLAALCPFTANYCAVGLTETWCLFSVALALLSFDAWLRQATTGKAWNLKLLSLTFALAFSVFLRPDQALLTAAVLPVMFVASWRKLPSPSPLRRLGPAVAVCLGLLLPTTLWTARNWHVFHVIQPLAPKYANDPGEPANYGFNRWYRTWAFEYKSNLDVYWAYDGDPLSMKDLPPRAFDSPAQQRETAAILARYNRETASTPPVEAAFNQLATKRIHSHPIRTLFVMPLARLANMWLRPRTEFMKLPLDWWRFRAHPFGSSVAGVYALLNLLLLLAAVKGLLRWRWFGWTGHAPLAAAALGYLALRCALLLTLDNSEPRYTIECYPIVLLLAAFAFSRPAHIDQPVPAG